MSFNANLDIISITKNSDGGRCGYCKATSNRKSFGLFCDNMKPETYFHLMNRGWRRCGTYFYKPANDSTCCPSYTIRCDAKKFVLSKSQRKVLKTFRKFLLEGKDAIKKKTIKTEINARGDEVSALNISEDTSKSVVSNSRIQCNTTKSDKSNKSRIKRYTNKLEKLKCQANGDNKLFEELLSNYKNRRLKRLDKHKSKSLSEYLDYSSLKEPKHFLEVKTLRCNPENKEFSESKKAEHKIYEKYQCLIHKDSPDDVSMEQFERFLVEGGLYHNKTCDKIDLKHPRRDMNQGQYHQQYWLDGNILIAVGVIDIVSCCLSSVYLFYDPDYSFLDLGVYSALFEINFINQLSIAYNDDDFKYYYMGFYIHSCSKMRYKAQYHGSMLLCPVAYKWVPVTICQEILNRVKFARFSPSTEKDGFSLERKSLGQLASSINACVSGKSYKLKRFLSHLSPEFQAQLEEFIRLIGAQISPILCIRLS